eukprot:CAMPEP_0194228152 /NCGR_PEP_ID=MMETSP0156-20130528/43227_1 /TAXON_ID=33649 /ORGANISM="Thalassionema nitzschioides, Strain L26-B" /LENGTH=237 /DNA_ID=CAMNT_0038960659 /DNA_START=87 /DNA_END=800 /DNA_ORIENTATION=+
MKLSLSILALATAANAFTAPVNQPQLAALKMADEAAEPEVPLMKVAEKVPCFGATPLIGEPKFIGENYWDKITTEWGSAATGQFVQAAELKHGRSAMIATVGFAFHKLGFTLNNISPHEYLSVTQGVKFADLQAMSPIDAIHAVPPEGLAQMFAAITMVEIFELTHRGGKLAEDETVAPGLQPGGLTGDLGWNPLQIKVTDRRRLVELQNGRAAMFAISAWVANEAVSGSVPLPLPW